MQLYAINSKKKLVFVEQAERKETYHCPECSSAVKVRGGHWRRKHFYHLAGSSCRQSLKSLEHIQVQCYLKEHLEGEVYLEKRFSEVNRIADVVWEKEKIIFEVQVSPITAEEVALRNRDYQKMGYQVIWLLHEKSFNQDRLTAAEHYLLSCPHYHTNINADGQGEIYDEPSDFINGRRLRRGQKAFIKLFLRRQRLKGVRKAWPCYLEASLDPEKKKEKKRPSFLKRGITLLYQMLLERACK